MYIQKGTQQGEAGMADPIKYIFLITINRRINFAMSVRFLRLSVRMNI